MQSSRFDEVKLRLTQIYTYLQSLDQLRNPVKKSIDDHLWKLWFKDLPEYPTIESDFFTRLKRADVGQEDAEVYLRVQRPELTVCPEPPESLETWLQPGWQKIENEPAIVVHVKAEPDADGQETEVEVFEDDPSRVVLYQQWLDERNEWKRAEWSARETMKVFDRMYQLNASIEREQDQVELILGDGNLSWMGSTGPIQHPLLLQKVRLHFDPSKPEFTVLPLEGVSTFYSALFRDMDEVAAFTVKSCLAELELTPCNPLDQQPTDEWCKRVASFLSSRGEFIPYSSEERSRPSKDPIIFRNPVLFLRRRSLGYAQSLESILNHLANSESLPEAVTRITGIDTTLNSDPGISESARMLDLNGDDEEVYFTKDANMEQLDIALKIQQYGSVLVQGPPGTGKTHTIANLIGHLLAEGKSILVTSHTSKALQVLRDKVAEPLQGLCVSVVQEEMNNKQLDQSIDMISEQLSSINPRWLEDEIDQLVHRRHQILAEIRRCHQDIKMIREHEYTSIVYLGESFDPSVAARLVRQEAELMQYIPGSVALGIGLPLTSDELITLYATNDLVEPDEEQELNQVSYNPEKLSTPEQFEEWVFSEERLAGSERTLHHAVMDVARIAETNQLEQLLAFSLRHAAAFTNDETWKLVLIAAGAKGGADVASWQELLEAIDSHMERYLLAKQKEYRYEIAISATSDEEDQHYLTIREILRYLEAGGKLNRMTLLLHPKWAKVIKAIQLNGTPPTSVDQFRSVSVILEHRIQRRLLLGRWRRQVKGVGGLEVEALGGEPELLLPQLREMLEQLLSWNETYQMKIHEAWQQSGLDWSSLLGRRPRPLVPYAEWVHLKQVLESELPILVESIKRERDWLAYQGRLNELSNHIQQAESDSNLVRDLYKAVLHRDVTGYRSLHRHANYLWNKQGVWKDRMLLLKKLSIHAADWAAAIASRSGVHGEAMMKFDAHRAWMLRQLEGELDRRQALSLPVLQQSLAASRQAFRDVTVQLVEHKAWLAVKKKTTLDQQMALQGWKQVMKRFGKGTGTQAERWMAEARKLMPLCQSAVPVWIMPINRVVESFDPARNHFDVVIIDEASQADVMALTALYLGQQVIVVGDDNQVSPEAVGQKQLEVQKLIETLLEGIPNALLYDGQMSIYDLAKMTFAGMTQLREHFRCVEPIIQFSNGLSYYNKIKPLRDASSVVRRPHTVAYRVEGSTNATAKINRVEAESVASLLMAAAESEEYHNATFGVITLLGDDQALVIDDYLRRYMDPVNYNRHKIRCGNSAQFQGDERDVIFLSMVYTPGSGGPLSMLNDAGERMKKRYNVAASRARDQMWLIYSLNEATDLKEGDLRKRLIQHMLNPMAETVAIQNAEQQVESEFERMVLERLVREGYRVIPQWKVGAYRIDFVVEGGGKRIAVECDGEKWHPLDKLGEDIARQTILERLGWTFHRIRGSVFFRDPDAAMRELFVTLERNGVTRDLHAQAESYSLDGKELKQRIIQRAEAIREEWASSEDEFPVLKKTGRTYKRRNEKDSKVEGTSVVLAEPTMSTEQPVRASSPVENKQDTPERHVTSDAVEGDFDVLTYLNENGLRYVDKRIKGGALWILGDRRLEPLLKPLKEHGLKLNFLPKGGTSTKNQPGWFLK